MENYSPPRIVGEIVQKYDEAMGHHAIFVRDYERRERAYKGILRASSDAAKWKHKLAPKYGFNLIETIVANTIEENLRFTARPAPHIDMTLEEATEMLEQAEVVEQLIRHEHRIDDMDEKQRPLFLTAAIGGYGVGKSYWNYTTGAVRRQGVVNVPVYGPNDEVLGSVPTIQEITEEGTLRDHSTFEVIDPRDFIVHESARALQPMEPGGAQHMFHRSWYSYEQLKTYEASGFFSNVDALKESIDFQDEYRDREGQVYQLNYAKDLIEVLEYWCFEDGEVYRAYVGNRKVLLRDKEASPFWHGGYPFVTTASMPYPFSFRGMSDIELIESIQNMIWEMTNQTMDNVELVNNAIMLISTDVDDADAFEHYPGARWPVDRPDQVEALKPDYQVANVAMQHIALLKGDLQNVTAAAPFASGTDSATVDQKTATGASIVMSAAQRRLASKKYQAQLGLRKEAEMRLKNIQQFMDNKKLIHIVGREGQLSFREVHPEQIQGSYLVELEPVGESMMKQEKRAEATQFVTTIANLAPLAAAGGDPISTRQLIAWYAHKWDIDDWERFFGPPAAPVQAMGGQGPPPPGGGAADIAPDGTGGANNTPDPGPNMGITAGSAVDASKPSATGGNSLSPMMMFQRAAALGGGG